MKKMIAMALCLALAFSAFAAETDNVTLKWELNQIDGHLNVYFSETATATDDSLLEVAITPDEDSSGLVGTSDAFYLCWDILNSSENGVDISLYASGPLKGETNGETIDWSLAIGNPQELDSGTTNATRVVETFAKDETNGYYTSEAPLQIVTYTGNAFGDKGAVPLTLTTVDASKNQKDTYKATLNAVIATI